MNKVFKILTLLSILGLIVGLKTISYDNTVLDDSAVVCCDNGLCNYVNPAQTTKCTSRSSMSPKSLCEEIVLTCKDCVDLTISSCLCYGGSNSCLNTNGTVYYGSGIVPCNINK
jgi:hypothetical protein